MEGVDKRRKVRDDADVEGKGAPDDAHEYGEEAVDESEGDKGEEEAWQEAGGGQKNMPGCQRVI